MAKTADFHRYKRKYKKQYANLEGDMYLTPRQKRRFRSHWSRFNSGSIEAFAQKFFWDPRNQQLGPEQTIDDSAVLGHVRCLTSLARRFTEFPALALDLHHATRLVRDLAFLNAASLRRRFARMFRLGETFSSHLMWSYRNPSDQTDPFNGIRLADLPCRLALPSFGATQHIVFGHEQHPAVRYTIPTAFDAGLSKEWFPGGFTKPLKMCAKLYPLGLPEIVHVPARFDFVATHFQII